ncbi:MAG: hypothetical protein WD066_10690 [Planctomycetaceae bacterium]
MSTATKVVLILAAIFGGFVMLCCGGLAWFGWRAQQSVIRDPDGVREATATIAEIEIPERFRPVGGLDTQRLPVVGRFMPGGMRMVMYESPSGGALMLMALDRELLAGEDDPETLMRRMLEQQKAPRRPHQVEVDPDDAVVREFEVRGRTVPFQFTKARDEKSGVAGRQVMGVFDAQDGNSAILVIFVPETEYDEAEIVRIIESIE